MMQLLANYWGFIPTAYVIFSLLRTVIIDTSKKATQISVLQNEVANIRGRLKSIDESLKTINKNIMDILKK